MRLILGLLLLVFSFSFAEAQTNTKICFTTNGTNCVPVSASNPFPVNASVSASIAGFAPALAYATITSVGTSTSVALPTNTGTVVFDNTGTTAVSCTLGVGSATAVASQNIIQPGSGKAFTVGSNTFAACIDQTGSASNVVVLSGGSGLATGWGGGSSGGGGGGGAATIADGADVTEGAIADGAASFGGTGTVSAKLRLVTTQLNTLATDIGAPGATACASDTGSCDNNAQNQRIAQRLTTLIGTINAGPGTLNGWGLGNFGAAIGTIGVNLGAFDGTNLIRLKGDETSGLWVNIKSGGGSGGTSSTFAAAFPSVGTAIGFSSGGNMVAPSSANPFPVTATGLASGATTSGTTGSAVMCSTTTTLTGGANGTTNWINCTPAGAVRNDISTIVGIAVDANSGNLTSGTQRTTLATNSLALPTWGHVATGAAPPSGSTYISALTSGATGGFTAGLIQCDKSAPYDASTNGSTELQALTSGRTIYVCGYSILSGGTVNVKLIYGTGTACATGSANMTPAYQLTAQVGIVDKSPFWSGLKTASANALCINTSAGVAVQAMVYYAII